MFCSKCGSAVDNDAKFCGSCGTSIAEVTKTQEVETDHLTSQSQLSNNQIKASPAIGAKKLFIFLAILVGTTGILILASVKTNESTQDNVPSLQAANTETSSSSSSGYSLPKLGLVVNDIGLGRVKTPCNPKEETYVDIMNTPTEVRLECTVGDERDSTTISFSGDGKTVVRVLKTQYTTPSDPPPEDIVAAAVTHYGSPVEVSLDNWLAIYGDAFSVSKDGNRVEAHRNDTGIGMLIKGYICADGSYRSKDCGNKGTRVIEYDLIDVPSFLASIVDAKARAEKNQAAKISTQKF